MPGLSRPGGGGSAALLSLRCFCLQCASAPGRFLPLLSPKRLFSRCRSSGRDIKGGNYVHLYFRLADSRRGGAEGESAGVPRSSLPNRHVVPFSQYRTLLLVSRLCVVLLTEIFTHKRAPTPKWIQPNCLCPYAVLLFLYGIK